MESATRPGRPGDLNGACTHPRAAHRHGTRACYVADRCRCDACTRANRYAMKRREYARTHGAPPPLVDAAPARAHCLDLMAAGMGCKTVAKEAGISKGIIQRLIWGGPDRGPSKRITRAHSDAILATGLRVTDHYRVDALGTIRRLQALSAAGWKHETMAGWLAMSPKNFTRLICGRQGHVAAWRARRAAALYEQRWQGPDGHPGPTARAAREGWAPPLAWDDDTIDDPDARPAGARRPGERRDMHAYADLLDIGCTADEIAAHLGVSQMRARNTIQTRTRRAAA